MPEPARICHRSRLQRCDSDYKAASHTADHSRTRSRVSQITCCASSPGHSRCQRVPWSLHEPVLEEVPPSNEGACDRGKRSISALANTFTTDDYLHGPRKGAQTHQTKQNHQRVSEKSNLQRINSELEASVRNQMCDVRQRTPLLLAAFRHAPSCYVGFPKMGVSFWGFLSKDYIVFWGREGVPLFS